MPVAGTMLRHAEQAMVHARRYGSRIHRYDPDEASAFDDGWWTEGVGADDA